MRNRKSTRARGAHKPKFYEVHGHRLTPQQYADFQFECQRRRNLAWESEVRNEQPALEEVLDRARPSLQVHKQLETMAHWNRASSALLTLGSLKGGMLYKGGADPKLTALYDAILCHVAAEFLAVGQELGAMHQAIAAELAERRP